MSTTVGELLRTMSIRLSMIDDGVTNPHPAVTAATRLLVDRLSALPADEGIQVASFESPLLARYIRASTGDVLAEIRLPNDA